MTSFSSAQHEMLEMSGSCRQGPIAVLGWRGRHGADAAWQQPRCHAVLLSPPSPHLVPQLELLQVEVVDPGGLALRWGDGGAGGGGLAPAVCRGRFRPTLGLQDRCSKMGPDPPAPGCLRMSTGDRATRVEARQAQAVNGAAETRCPQRSSAAAAAPAQRSAPPCLPTRQHLPGRLLHGGARKGPQLLHQFRHPVLVLRQREMRWRVGGRWGGRGCVGACMMSSGAGPPIEPRIPLGSRGPSDC